MRLNPYALLLAAALSFCGSAPALAVSFWAAPVERADLEPAVVNGVVARGPAAEAPVATAQRLTRAERKEVRRTLRETLRAADVSTNTLLLVIVAILLPPLAMLLYEGGLTKRFWISLLLTLLVYLPGLIYTLFVILTGR